MEEIDLKEVYSYYKSKIFLILMTINIVLIVGNIYTTFIRVPMYQSNTTIVLVNDQKREYSQTDQQLNKNLIGTYSHIVKSRKVLSKVIENLDLATDTDTLANNISVSAIEGTEIIKIVVNNQDANQAKEITDEAAKIFTAEIKRLYNLENIEVLDKAVVSTSAYNVNFVKDNAIFALVGIVLSCTVVFVMYYFDTTIKSSEIVEEKLGLTILGVVPCESRDK